MNKMDRQIEHVKDKGGFSKWDVTVFKFICIDEVYRKEMDY